MNSNILHGYAYAMTAIVVFFFLVIMFLPTNMHSFADRGVLVGSYVLCPQKGDPPSLFALSSLDSCITTYGNYNAQGVIDFLLRKFGITFGFMPGFMLMITIRGSSFILSVALQFSILLSVMVIVAVLFIMICLVLLEALRMIINPKKAFDFICNFVGELSRIADEFHEAMGHSSWLFT